MIYKIGEKSVRISDDTISHYMRTMALSKEEAIQIYLEDEGYIKNEEQETLEAKAKANRITATIHQARGNGGRAEKNRVKKSDPTKEEVITTLAASLPSVSASNIQITNPTKNITFTIGGESYTIDLIRNRNKNKK